LIQRSVRRRSLYQRRSMRALQRLQPHVLPLKRYRFNPHDIELTMSQPLPEANQITIRRQDQQLTLVIALVCRSMDIALRQLVQLRLQLSVQRIDIAHIEVVPKVSLPSGRFRRILTPPDANAAAVAIQIRVVAHTRMRTKSKHVLKESHRTIKLSDRHVHERRCLDEVPHDASLL